jgi:hypothetical protein
MNNLVLFVLILLSLAWGLYKCIKEKNERLFYSILIAISIFSAKYPFRVPLEFVFSFNGFLGCGVLLYKGLYKKPDRSLLSFSATLFAFGVAFLLQGLLFPGLAPGLHVPFWIALELTLAFCGLLGFGVLLYKILHKKVDKTLIVFDVVLLLLGIICLLQSLFLIYGGLL